MFEFRITFQSGLNLQHPNISSDNGLAPTWRQAIDWNNYGKIMDAHMSLTAWMR